VSEAEEAKRTRFSIIKLPNTQRFACGRKDIKAAFSQGDIGWVSVGVIKTLKLGTRHFPKPKFQGPVVADLSVGRSEDSKPILCLFPVRIDQYPDAAAEEFRSTILPKMKEWLRLQLTKPDTSRAGNADYFVVEWTGGRHRLHYIRWR